ncbi:hypothetical protein IFM89_016593 [Coptis chinensis]|uniref:Uncharacterized protein n=1 Tax=Coptis chinensis TaxID=261450 RepID=A0A835IVN8_9MAGN|nr:hypothetical protein IFM89_016593 [Coptis chinensis]
MPPRWMEIAKRVKCSFRFVRIIMFSKSNGKHIIEGSYRGSHSDFTGPTSRSTTCIAIVPNNRVVVANAGDYHCVISRKGELIVFKLALSPVD